MTRKEFFSSEKEVQEQLIKLLFDSGKISEKTVLTDNIDLMKDFNFSERDVEQYIKNVENCFGITYTYEDEDVTPKTLSRFDFLKRFVIKKIRTKDVGEKICSRINL